MSGIQVTLKSQEEVVEWRDVRLNFLRTLHQMLDDPDEFAKGRFPCDPQHWRWEGHKHVVGAFLDVGHDVR